MGLLPWSEKFSISGMLSLLQSLMGKYQYPLFVCLFIFQFVCLCNFICLSIHFSICLFVQLCNFFGCLEAMILIFSLQILFAHSKVGRVKLLMLLGEILVWILLMWPQFTKVHMFQWSLINSINCYFGGPIQSVPFRDNPLYTYSCSKQFNLATWQHGNHSFYSHLAIMNS